MMLFGVTVTGLLTLFQTASSFRFYRLTKHMKEVGWMPHVINILTIMSAFFITNYYWLFYQRLEQSVLISLVIPGY